MILSKRLKKTFAAFAAAVILATGIAGVSAYAADGIVPGDVNSSGDVSIKDVTFLQKVLVLLEKEPDHFIERADMNLDGVVKIKDATIIQMFLADMIDTLPLKPETNPTETTTATGTGTQPGTTAKPTEATEPETAKPIETVKPTEATEAPTFKPSETVAPTPTETAKPTEATTAAPTQPDTDEEGWENKIYRP